MKNAVGVGSKKLSYKNLFNTYGDKIDIEKFTDIDPQNISEEYATIGSKIAFIGACLGSAIEEHKSAEMEYRIWRANVEEDLQKKSRKAGEKLTKPEMENRRRKHPEYRMAQQKVFSAERRVKYLEGLYKGIQAKANILPSAGKRASDELDAEISRKHKSIRNKRRDKDGEEG